MTGIGQLGRALQEEARRWAKIETGGEPLIEGLERTAGTNCAAEPFAVAFRMQMPEPWRKQRWYTVVITESE